MNKQRDIDFTNKIILIIVLVIISFLLLFLVLSTFLVQDNTSWNGMKGRIMNQSPDYTVPFVVSLALALLVGMLILL